MCIRDRENPNLVRGLDYYTHAVFEWVTQDLGSQGAVCAGGRYDGLVERLGGRSTPAVGFAIGLDRVVLLHELAQANVEPEDGDRSADVYLCVTQPECNGAALAVANALRAALPTLRVRQHLGGGNLKKQLKKADACGAVVAILIDDESLDQETLTIKHLRDASLGQETVTFEAGIARLQHH